MLKVGVAELVTTKCSSLVVFVPKRDGILRFCADFRRLNAATVRDSYPIPRMDVRSDSVEKARMFSTLDANSGN